MTHSFQSGKGSNLQENYACITPQAELQHYNITSIMICQDNQISKTLCLLDKFTIIC